jgi:ABC-type bacteriocin/lantibiotic exporter with double-glycine peptidase domain
MKYQKDSFSCGAAAVVNALRCFGVRVPEKRVRAHSATTEKDGTNEHGIRNALERLGFAGDELRMGKEGAAWTGLTESVEGGSPVILLFDRWQHWTVAAGILGKDRIVVVDSTRTKKNKEENGVHVYTRKQLFRRWHRYQGEHYGISVRKQ